MELTKEEILDAVQKYGTGGLPETKQLGSEIYGSIHLNPLHGLASVRDTAKRFKQFSIGFENKSVIDFGCHIGALSFYALKSGARVVNGIESNPKRVETARAIADFNGLTADKINFLYEPIPGMKADVVICCSVDDYILDKNAFYQMLLDMTDWVLIFESNVQVYDTHPFSEFCMERRIQYQWVGEAIDKYPYGANRTRNLFRVFR